MLRQTSCRLLAVLLLSAGPWPLAANAADQELDRPYDLRIVLHVAEHRLLTDVFRDRVAREVSDGMQAAFGDLARVSVVDKHPRLKDVLARGLDHGLDGWVERDGIKTHFVLIDFTGVYYEIQARQHDGITGRVGPAVRRDRTRDRDFVARAASLLIERDFGLVGTVVSAPAGDPFVKVKLAAGALGSLTRWVRKGEVFEIVPPGSTTALDWALLQVETPPGEGLRDGVCICRLWRNSKTGSILQSRCVMLGTTKAPLRLHFVQYVGPGLNAPLDRTVGVQIRQFGFEGENVTMLAKTSDAAGWINTAAHADRGTFEHVAFVSVVKGLPGVPQLPIPIIDDRPVLIPVAVKDDPGGLFTTERATWEQNITDSLHVQDNLFKELQEMATQPDTRARAVEKARAGLQRTKADYDSLQGQLQELQKQAAEKKVAFTPTGAIAKLKALKDNEDILEKYLKDQAAIDREENDPKKKDLRNQIEQGKLYERDLELGKAIKVYEKVLADGIDTPELRKRVADLKALWVTKDEKHLEARNFIYKVWSSQDAAGLKAKMPEVKAAFEQCKRVGDVITAKKLQNLTSKHAETLDAERKKLNPKINIDDEKPARLIEEVSKGLVELHKSVNDFLKLKAGDDK